jgi:hypothetical protein
MTPDVLEERGAFVLRIQVAQEELFLLGLLTVQEFLLGLFTLEKKKRP